VIARKYENDGLLVLGVNAWDEPRSDLAKFARQKHLKQDILLNGGKVFEHYGLTTVPTVLFINKEGVVVDTEVGYGGPESLLAKAKALLGKD